MYRNSDARQRVLARLKERGPATVDELASEMGVVAVTMRSHLSALREQGLVAAEDQRGHVGRPRRRYYLTEQAENMYPNRCGGLAADLLDCLQSLAGSRGVDQLLDVAAARQASQQADKVHGRTLEERVPLVADALRQESGLADWWQDGERFIIRELHCPYSEAARGRTDLCRYHTQVVTRLVGEPVTLERAIARGDRHCLFSVAGRPALRPSSVRRFSDGRPAPEEAPSR